VRLEAALERGYIESAAPLAAIYQNPSDAPVDLPRILDILRPAVRMRDPWATLMAADFHMRHDLLALLSPTRALHEIRAAAASGYPPAVHRLGEVTSLGLLGVGKSSSKAYQLFVQAATAGHRPSLLRVADMLLSGDGTNVNCPEAIAHLRRIVDAGPWSAFFDTYQEAGSRHAFLKMIDMGLTPGGWQDISTENGTIGELIRMTGYVPDALQTAAGMKMVRAARGGDEGALIWLILRAPLGEAVEWLKRIELMPPTTAVLAPPLRWYVTTKGLLDWALRRLTDKEQGLLKTLVRPVCDTAITLATIGCLISLVVMRIRIIFD
jgi:hypothetical protein